MALTPEQRVLRSRLGAYAQQAQGRTNTGPARKAWEERFVDQVDPERKLSPEERARRAEAARRAYMTGLALKSSKSRSKKAKGKAA